MAAQHVGIAQMAMSGRTGDEITMLGLGSCVGIFLAATDLVVAAHCLLPGPARAGDAPAKHVDTAVPHLLEQVRRAGRRSTQVVACVAGGAAVLTFGSRRPELDVGARNAAAARQALASAGVTIRCADLGGTTARQVTMTVGSLDLAVRTPESRWAVAARAEGPIAAPGRVDL